MVITLKSIDETFSILYLTIIILHYCMKLPILLLIFPHINDSVFFSLFQLSLITLLDYNRALSYRPKRVPQSGSYGDGLHDGRSARGRSSHDASQAAGRSRIRIPSSCCRLFAILWTPVVQVRIHFHIILYHFVIHDSTFVRNTCKTKNNFLPTKNNL